MCGIYGYIGKKDATQQITTGLKRLEYRGYDSWGVAVLNKGVVKIARKVGAIGDHDKNIDLPHSVIGIGHTRWATHGGVNETNAHPHLSSDKSFALAQNGIVENYLVLKSSLQNKGHNFQTETDTEVIVCLIEEKLKQTKNLEQAVRLAFLNLKGRNTIILLTTDGQIIAARNGSPLVVGINEETEEVYFSSDTLSFAPFVKKMIVVENGQMVYYKDNKITLQTISEGKEISYKLEDINLSDNTIDKEGYPHFMLKEIHESSYVIQQLLNQDLTPLEDFAKIILKSKNIYTIASGTAGIAASQIAFYLRVNAKVNAINLIGADALEYYGLFTSDDILISPSQSGETADVLEVLEIAKKRQVKIASFVNMAGSSMSRISDYKFLSQAGPEVCVMSTKVFVSQLAWGYLLSKAVEGKFEQGKENLKNLADRMDKYLKNEDNHLKIKELAKKLKNKKDIFLLGKYQNLNIVKEGMVKLIEGAYIHAHAIPAGDLKHYAITLMEKGVPVIFALSNDIAKADTLNAVNEVKARGADVIAIAPFNYESFDFHLSVPDMGETSAILNIIPLQLLAYYLTVGLGHNVDKPRNIAKSVTVK